MKKVKTSKRAKRKVEKLHHFNCAFCGKWWSIGDAPARRRRWFCPWCGRNNKIG